jgi:hypothetical protein
VNARSSSARPKRTLSASLTRPPGPWRTSRRHARGMPLVQTSVSARWISSSAGNHGCCRTLISAHSGGQDRAAPPGAPLVPLAVCDYLNVAREQHLKPGRECRCLATFTSSCTQGNSSTRYSFEGNVQMRTDDKSPLEGRTAGARDGSQRVQAAPDPSRPARIIRPVRGSLLDSVRPFGTQETRWHARGRFNPLSSTARRGMQEVT